MLYSYCHWIIKNLTTEFFINIRFYHSAVNSAQQTHFITSDSNSRTTKNLSCENILSGETHKRPAGLKTGRTYRDIDTDGISEITCQGSRGDMI